MKILVCIKQIAEPESDIKLNSGSLWIIEDNKTVYRMNRYDEYALEEALLLKDAGPGVIVDVITVGPLRSNTTVKKALEKGADNGIHIKNENLFLTAIETASLIAAYAADQHYDIIFAGVMSEDLMQSQVGPMIASLLSIPCAVSVVKSVLINNSTSISVYSELEGGVLENIEVSLPCLVTVQTGVSRPRYPSLSNVLRARSLEVLTINSDSLEIAEAHEKILSVNYPPVSSKGTVISGSSEEKADKLLDILHEKALI